MKEKKRRIAKVSISSNREKFIGIRVSTSSSSNYFSSNYFNANAILYKFRFPFAEKLQKFY